MMQYSLTHLKQLEAESIHILREVVAEFEHPVMLYSVGKDSSVMVRLAQKAFHPGTLPFPLLHVDTGYKFKKMYDFRDRFVKDIGADLVIHKSEQSGTMNPFDHGTRKCCAILKTQALLDALREGGFDAAFGGARREEEKSRAKERVYSFRDEFGQWDPKNQRPELWSLYNAQLNRGETIRAFPISNWTELDVWQYVYMEDIPVVPMYFAEERDAVLRDGQIISLDGRTPNEGEQLQRITCRFRSLGCHHCTGAIESNAKTVPQIIEEMMTVRISERSTRVIDHDAEGSMEMKKREGYF